jgi:hypothetical protein
VAEVVDDVELLELVVAPLGAVVVELGTVDLGWVVDVWLGTVVVVIDVVLVADGTEVVGVAGVDVVVEPGAGVVGLGDGGAGTYVEHFPLALHTVMSLELTALELGSRMP